MGNTEIVLWVVFVISAALYFWVGKSFVSKPHFNVPRVFWSSAAAKAFLLAPQLGFLAVVIGGFVFTEHGWWFLGAVVAAVVILSSRPSAF